MSEEKKGRVKLTLEVEINEPLMDAIKEMATKMPDVWRHAREREKANVTISPSQILFLFPSFESDKSNWLNRKFEKRFIRNLTNYKLGMI